jgi:hypothetical protein
MTCGTPERSLRDAPWTASVGRRATRGSSAISPPVQRAWRSVRARRAPPRLRRLRPSSRPASRGAVGPLHGAPRPWWRSCPYVLRAGPCPGAPRAATCCAAMAWSRRNDTLAIVAIRGSPPAHSWPPTRSGAPRSKASFKPVTACPVTLERGPMATAVFSSAATPSLPPVSPKPSLGSPASSPRSVGPRASAPTTGCPAPPRPWAGSPNAPPGGSAWGSAPKASSPAHLSTMAAMSACTTR